MAIATLDTLLFRSVSNVTAIATLDTLLCRSVSNVMAIPRPYNVLKGQLPWIQMWPAPQVLSASPTTTTAPSIPKAPRETLKSIQRPRIL
jgi:hypothetical protein